MTVHHARILGVAAVLIGIGALIPLAACNGTQQTLDEQQVLVVPVKQTVTYQVYGGHVRLLPEYPRLWPSK